MCYPAGHCPLALGQAAAIIPKWALCTHSLGPCTHRGDESCGGDICSNSLQPHPFLGLILVWMITPVPRPHLGVAAHCLAQWRWWWWLPHSINWPPFLGLILVWLITALLNGGGGNCLIQSIGLQSFSEHLSHAMNHASCQEFRNKWDVALL